MLEEKKFKNLIFITEKLDYTKNIFSTLLNKDSLLIDAHNRQKRLLFFNY